MAEETEPEIKIHEPDRSMQRKIGTTNLEQILSPKIVKAAEATIQESSDEFWAESVRRLAEMEMLYGELLKAGQDPKDHVAKIGAVAFAIKVSAGLGGYALVSTLAKSLHRQCEYVQGKKLAPRNMEIIKWHVDTIKQLLTAKILGDGGPAGISINAELERLASQIRSGQ